MGPDAWGRAGARVACVSTMVCILIAACMPRISGGGGGASPAAVLRVGSFGAGTTLQWEAALLRGLGREGGKRGCERRETVLSRIRDGGGLTMRLRGGGRAWIKKAIKQARKKEKQRKKRNIDSTNLRASVHPHHLFPPPPPPSLSPPSLFQLIANTHLGALLFPLPPLIHAS